MKKLLLIYIFVVINIFPINETIYKLNQIDQSEDAARKSNFSQFESFLYSATISTFLWEYGIESFVEPPSIQDLTITPIVGSIFGEYLYNIEKMIIANDGKVGDSRLWGKLSLFFIDPIGSTSNIIGLKDKEVMGYWNFSFDEKKEINGLGINVVGTF